MESEEIIECKCHLITHPKYGFFKSHTKECFKRMIPEVREVVKKELKNRNERNN